MAGSVCEKCQGRRGDRSAGVLELLVSFQLVSVRSSQNELS